MSTQLISTGIQFPDATTQTTAAAGLGDGQTWQDVTASRAINTTYTNSTGRTIYVVVYYQTSQGGATSTFTLDGYAYSNYAYNINIANYWAYNTWAFVIPNGSTYRCTAKTNWRELR